MTRGRELSHAIPGRHPVAEALRAGRTLREVVVEERPGRELESLAARARDADVAVRAAPRAVLDDLAAGVLHQGVVALAPPFRYRAVADVAGADLLVVLDGVTDPHNLGAIARSAELAGAGGLVLPRRRSVHVTPAAEKSAAGALSWLPVAQAANVAAALAQLGAAGIWTVGLAGEAGEAIWGCTVLDERVALVVGAEGRGLARLVAERCDALVTIPAAGRLASLNASVAAGIALFEVRRRRACAQRTPEAREKPGN